MIAPRALRLTSLDVRTYVFAAALAALFVTLTELIDLFELPFESLPGHLLSSSSLISTGFVMSTMVSFGYAGVFILMLLESTSLPVPSEIVLPFAGYLVFTGSMNFAAVVLVSTAAGVVGALADYYLASKLGRPIVERLFRWSGMKPEHLDRRGEVAQREGVVEHPGGQIHPGAEVGHLASGRGAPDEAGPVCRDDPDRLARLVGSARLPRLFRWKCLADSAGPVGSAVDRSLPGCRCNRIGLIRSVLRFQEIEGSGQLSPATPAVLRSLDANPETMTWRGDSIGRV